mmetsp:Transcript_26498/g.49532  ORF Transcript_26498/g.49532 Transcript_26498/m.49532 type:complete len:233 (-) Transcript_26498:166-864(-)
MVPRLLRCAFLLAPTCLMAADDESSEEGVGSDSGSFTDSGNEDPTGLVYIHNIPPTMSIRNIRQKLTPFGRIKRVFLLPKNGLQAASSSSSSTRNLFQQFQQQKPQKLKRNSKFTQGWIEFSDKMCAKASSKFLDTQPIGGKLRTKFRHRTWHLTYLPNFKWTNLTAWLNAKMSQYRKELAEYQKAKKQAERKRRYAEKKQKRRKRALALKGCMSSLSSIEEEEENACDSEA